MLHSDCCESDIGVTQLIIVSQTRVYSAQCKNNGHMNIFSLGIEKKEFWVDPLIETGS